MGVTQPYLYDAAPKYNGHDPYNGFDPKAVTRASRAPPPEPKLKQEGPLINFNKHPDSYLVLPYGNTDAKQMNPKTKVAVKWMRWIQLIFRFFQFIAAIGLLVCAISIRGAGETEGWIIRIPPGADIAVCSYAIYHLCRSAKGRTPASSASYHFFALITDAGFIPFYVFIAMMANNNRISTPGAEGRWRTAFNNDDATQKILTATWLAAISTGGMHLASFFLDIWLVVVFRKISHLPPDMNPLEDNLTSRRATKHKHKNSEASASMISEKHMSDASTLSTSGPYRGSQSHDPLIKESRPVSFFHTRNDSAASFSPHTPESARHSRINLEKHQQFYNQPYSARTSRTDLKRNSTMETQSKRSSAAISDISRSNLPSMVHSKRDSLVSTSGNIQRSSPASAAVANAVVEKHTSDLHSDNWFVHMETPQDSYEPMRRREPEKSPNHHSQRPRRDSIDFSSDEEDLHPVSYADVPAPLRMNPPTPPHSRTPDHFQQPRQQQQQQQNRQQQQQQQEQHYDPPSPLQQPTQPTTTLTRNPTTLSTISSVSSLSSATISHASTATPKSRYYGSLRSATRNLRPVGGSPSPKKNDDRKATPKKGLFEFGDYNGAARREESPRVVSRTGLDVDGDLGLGGAGWRRREVSGKMAEEGRVGLYR